MLVMLEKQNDEMIMDAPSDVMVQYVKVFISENNDTYLYGSCLGALDDREDTNYDLNKYYKIDERTIDCLIENRNIQDKSTELRKEYFSVTPEELESGYDAHREIQEGQLYDYYKSQGFDDAQAMVSSAMYFGRNNEISIDELERTR